MKEMTSVFNVLFQYPTYAVGEWKNADAVNIDAFIFAPIEQLTGLNWCQNPYVTRDAGIGRMMDRLGHLSRKLSLMRTQ